jgi:hypothetical protein
MARSSLIKGLLVRGETLDELFDELPVVAQSLYAACQEKGWDFVKGASKARRNDIEGFIPYPFGWESK